MKGFWIVYIVALFLLQGECRKLKKKVELSKLGGSYETFFLTKFDIGAGEGKIDIKFKYMPVYLEWIGVTIYRM